MIDSSILLKASRSWLVYNSYSSFLPLYLEIGTMFTFFPVFWCLTCPPRALKEKCLYFWDGAYKYVLRISLNMADLKTFNLTKLVLSVPEGGNGMLSSGDLWTSLIPSCFQCSASSVPFIASHAGSRAPTDTSLSHLLPFVIAPKPQAKASETLPAKFRELCVASNCLHHCERHTYKLPIAY